MKFHVARRGGGGTINFGFPARGEGGGGHVKIATIKSLIFSSLASLAQFYKSVS